MKKARDTKIPRFAIRLYKTAIPNKIAGKRH